MNSQVLRIESSDLVIFQIQEATQTSGVTINSQVLLQDVDKSVNGSVTLFEFCHVLHEPEYPKPLDITKESVSENNKKHLANYIENRYKICREIIKPYTPDSTASSEHLLKKAIESSGSDLASCFDEYTSEKIVFDIKQPSTISSASKVNATTSYSAMGDASKECLDKCKVAEDPEECIPQCEQEQSSSTPGPEKQCGPVKPEPKKCGPKKGSCKPKIKKVCSKESANRCDEPSTVIVIGERPQLIESDTIESINQKDLSNSGSDGSQKSSVETNNETVATIKTAMDNFMDNVLKKTQDAIHLVATESIKQLTKTKLGAKSSESSNSDTDNQQNSSGSIFTSLFRKNKDEEPKENTDSLGPYAKEVVGTILTKVDSAFTILKEHISKSIESFPKSNYNNPHDVVKPKPSDVTHTFTPAPVPASNSYFSAIKNKICSMFTDGDTKVEEEANKLSTESSETLCSLHRDDEDEDV